MGCISTFGFAEFPYMKITQYVNLRLEGCNFQGSAY